MKKLLSLLGAVGLTAIGANSVVACKIAPKQNKLNNIHSLNNILNSEIIKKIENRGLNHSEFKPTGYFLKKGITYKIILNQKITSSESKNIKLTIGQWGKYNNLNQDNDNFSNYKILTNNQKISFTAENSGVLYISDNNLTNLQIINIITNNKKNIIKIPTFKINVTNQEEFIEQIKNTNSPFVEFVSNHFFATMQTKMIINQVLPALNRSFNNTLLHWDNVWNWTNEIYGLNENKNDIYKKYSQYIHIANADDSAGYANASNGRIMFHNSTNSGQDLFLEPIEKQWGLWHETGHTYQIQQYKWDGLGEVTVNISSLYIAEKLKLKKFYIRKINEKKIVTFHNLWDSKQKITEYLNKPNKDKKYNSIDDLFVKLTMFWQLHIAFGKHFYKMINEKYHEIFLNSEKSKFYSYNNDKKIQNFIKISSKISGYNLYSFFTKWGLYPNTETRNEIKNLKSLTKNIWENFTDTAWDNNLIIQENLNYKEMTIFFDIDIKKNKILNYGEKINIEKEINNTFNIKNIKMKKIEVLELETQTEDYSLFKIENKNYIITILKINENEKRINLFMFLFEVNLNNTIIFQGISDDFKGIMVLDNKNHKIIFFGNSDIIHYYFDKELYYNIKIEDKNDKLINDIKITGDQNWQEIIEKENLNYGIPYISDEYKVGIIPAEGQRVKIFKNDEYIPLGNKKTYLIKNDELVEI